MDALSRRLETALRLGQEAGVLALRRRPPPGGPQGTLKGAQDWLTEADGAVERLLADRLAAAFPDDGFVGEEGGAQRAGRLHWVVDPIDGTANFMRGGNRFCVSIGLVEDRTPLLGVIVAPALGEVFAARQGAGATLNGAPIHVADTTDLRRATVEIGWSPRRPNAAFMAVCTRVLDTGATLRMGGSGALGLADVAAGRQDAFGELHINLWDVAAGLAILAEAGAAVSPFLTPAALSHGNTILAAAPGVAAALAEATGLPPPILPVPPV
jgi:myo-inositol-1(or 4)-monophosphatase